MILRITFTFSLLWVHGLDKLQLFLAGAQEFPDPLGVGPVLTLGFLVLAEVLCPILVLVGFKVRYASLPVILAMAVALLIFHAGDPFADRELAYLYLAAFSVIALIGGGRYSLDGYLAIRSKSK